MHLSKYQVKADMYTVGYAGYVLQDDDHKAKLRMSVKIYNIPIVIMFI